MGINSLWERFPTRWRTPTVTDLPETEEPRSSFFELNTAIVGRFRTSEEAARSASATLAQLRATSAAATRPRPLTNAPKCSM
ncbi:unnamed protein product [Colias eurytheme]|nr:unnamed protein product [Colias eurytheme]